MTVWETIDLASTAPEFGAGFVVLDDLNLSMSLPEARVPPALGTTPRPGGASVTILLRVADSSEAVRIGLNDVIGLTVMEDVFGCDGGQITREGEGATDLAGAPLARSVSSDTIKHVRANVPRPFGDAVDEHAHFSLSLREHHLSIIAHRDCAITRVELEP